MAEKPTSASGYTSEQVELVRATCLYAATKLGDLTDELVIVGGLVPSLLIDQVRLPKGADSHVGTADLDVGLRVAILDQQGYATLTERLRRAGFSPDLNEHGNPIRQRWKADAATVTIDFLIQPTRPGDRGGALRDIEPDFAAIIAPGLHLAFMDRRRVTLSGTTLQGEEASREVWVCGAGAYVILKALAFRDRGENKNAYDLFYVIRNFGVGVGEVADAIRPLSGDASAIKAVEILEQDFLDHNAVGPRRVAEFRTGRSDDAIQADVVGFVAELLALLRAG